MLFICLVCTLLLDVSIDITQTEHKNLPLWIYLAQTISLSQSLFWCIYRYKCPLLWSIWPHLQVIFKLLNSHRSFHLLVAFRFALLILFLFYWCMTFIQTKKPQPYDGVVWWTFGFSYYNEVCLKINKQIRMEKIINPSCWKETNKSL